MAEKKNLAVLEEMERDIESMSNNIHSIANNMDDVVNDISDIAFLLSDISNSFKVSVKIQECLFWCGMERIKHKNCSLEH